MKAIGALAVLFLLLPSLAPAQDIPTSAPDAVVEDSSILTDDPISDYDYGTATYVYLPLTAWDAQPIDSTVTFNYVNAAGGQGVTRTGGSSFFKIPVGLPSGALVDGLELNYCDTGASTLAAHWFRQPKNASPVVINNVVLSSGTPGCVVTTGTFAAQTIDNVANSYNIEVFMGATDGTISLLSARVRYKLQVSAAPATATFPTDVPTSHPFFQYVEALAASGVTSGCGTGLYCPDQPVTRGQMAVFLAKALGLHF